MKTADLCDQFWGKQALQLCQTNFQNYGAKMEFCGSVFTVKVFEDNVLVRTAIETAKPGSVLVVDGEASRNCALLGGNLAALAQANGMSGIIIHGCVRDVAELAQTDLGILAVGSCPVKSRKDGQGELERVLNFGGVTWTPGHIVYADEDGVVVSPVPLEELPHAKSCNI